MIFSLENAFEGVSYIESSGRDVSLAEDRDSGLAWAPSHPEALSKNASCLWSVKKTGNCV